jgi:CubicO group peptidase (beta-lactamase class C family)
VFDLGQTLDTVYVWRVREPCLPAFPGGEADLADFALNAAQNDGFTDTRIADTRIHGYAGRHARLRSMVIPLLFPLVFLAAAAPAMPQEPTTERDRVDRIMADYSGPATPGAVVAVVRNGEVVFQRAYGMANLTHGIPFTVETRTNIGSTSKQFTAFAIALLADEGRLSLDDDVRSHIPELPDLGEVVTLRHLISHTSGYREYLNALAIGGWRLEAGDHIDRDEVLTVVQRQPALQNSPGAEHNYNNTGYALLALVVERVTGEAFPDWIRQNVFAPLGMNATVVRADRRQIVPNSAQGYAPTGDDGFREVGDIPASMGAGGIYTTVGDLAVWMRNLRTAELGGRAVMDRMTTRSVLTTGDTISYAMGLMVSTLRGLDVIQHGGADAAHRSTFIYHPGLDAGLIVQSNHAGFDGTIPARVAEVFFGEHMEPRQDDGVAADPGTFDPELFDASSFDAYVGRYEFAARPGFILRFWREEDRLLSQATGQPSVELTPTSDSTFAVPVVRARITFHRDDAGQVTGLTLHQSGTHTAHRLPDESEEARLDLSPYAGRYYSAEFETYYTVAIEDDHLVLRHRRRPPVTLNHARDDEFTGGFPVAGVVFDRDDRGRVTAFRASNGRARDVVFVRTD